MNEIRIKIFEHLIRENLIRFSDIDLLDFLECAQTPSDCVKKCVLYDVCMKEFNGFTPEFNCEDIYIKEKYPEYII